MLEFSYDALDASGYEIQSTIKASNKYAAIAEVRGLGLFPTRVTQISPGLQSHPGLTPNHDDLIKKTTKNDETVGDSLNPFRPATDVRIETLDYSSQPYKSYCNIIKDEIDSAKKRGEYNLRWRAPEREWKIQIKEQLQEQGYIVKPKWFGAVWIISWA